MLEPGALVDGRFVVEALIGQGGLAEVYRVRHAELGSLHALKLLVWKKKQLEERLLLEGRIQAQLRHPNVVSVTDLVRHDGQVGLLMEYVDHESLEDFVARAAPLPPGDALPLFAAILAGVTAAHDAGVLHRDLKPANVMLARSSSGILPKVADFGIAKVVQDMQGGRTAAGVTMGTPGYLAPEQILDSADADRRADVFALGAILYEMLTGRRAFADEHGEVSVRSTLEGEVTPIDELVEALDDHVSQAIHQSLARDRESRFEDCRAFARALYPDRPQLLALVTGQHVGGPLSLEGANPSIPPRPAPSVDTFVPEDEPASSSPTTSPGHRQSAALLMVGVGVGGGLAALAGLLALYASMSEPEVPPEPEPVAVVAPAPAPVAVPTPSPEPVAVEPEPAQVEPAAVAPKPGPAPSPSPQPTEVAPVPAPEPTPEPVAPAPEPVAPAPVPAPEPVVAPAPAPEPTLAVKNMDALVGTWAGEASGKPLELRIDSLAGGALSGELTFYLGATPRTLPAEGSIDAKSGVVKIRAGTFALDGVVGGLSMSGTYLAGKKKLPWNLVKGG
ncbi:MAG: hypothetical protein EP330_01415 [Deltaproteobacteria bacterium]|nr:MAG: hypothetical protein EP330_01415 [Deltaproteobacteria bacterium]